MRTAIIYYLADKKGVPFYVGQSIYPENRLKSHKVRFGNDISMEYLAEVLEEDKLKEEKFYIEMFISWGFKLQNKYVVYGGYYYNNYGGKTSFENDIKSQVRIKAQERHGRAITKQDYFEFTHKLINEIDLLQEELNRVRKEINKIKKQKNIPEGYSSIQIIIPPLDVIKHEKEERAKKKREAMNGGTKKRLEKQMLFPAKTPDTLIKNAKLTLHFDVN